MPLTSGPGSMKPNLHELTHGKVGSARRKAIKTLSKKWGVSEKEARAKQAWIIAKNKLKKHASNPRITKKTKRYID